MEVTKWICRQYFSRIGRASVCKGVREIGIEKEKAAAAAAATVVAASESSSSCRLFLRSFVHSFVCGTINIRLWTAFWCMPLNFVCVYALAFALALILSLSPFPISVFLFHSSSFAYPSQLYLFQQKEKNIIEKHLNISLWLSFHLYIYSSRYSWIILFFLSFGKWSLTVFHLDRISKAIFLLFFHLFVRLFSQFVLNFSFSMNFCPGKWKIVHMENWFSVCVQCLRWENQCADTWIRYMYAWECVCACACIWFELLKKQFHWWLVLNPLTNWVLGYFSLIHSFILANDDDEKRKKTPRWKITCHFISKMTQWGG